MSLLIFSSLHRLPFLILFFITLFSPLFNSSQNVFSPLLRTNIFRNLIHKFRVNHRGNKEDENRDRDELSEVSFNEWLCPFFSEHVQHKNSLVFKYHVWILLVCFLVSFNSSWPIWPRYLFRLFYLYYILDFLGVLNCCRLWHFWLYGPFPVKYLFKE